MKRAVSECLPSGPVRFCLAYKKVSRGLGETLGAVQFLGISSQPKGPMVRWPDGQFLQPTADGAADCSFAAWQLKGI